MGISRLNIEGAAMSERKPGVSGPFIPLSTLLKFYLPLGRKYTKLEAMFSLTLDFDQDGIKSVRAYARQWQWNRKTVKKFLEEAANSSGTTKYATEYTSKGPAVPLINKHLWGQGGREVYQQVYQQGTTTVHPSSYIREKKEKKEKDLVGQFSENGAATPGQIVRKFFKAWATPQLRGEQFQKFAALFSDTEQLDAFCAYWTEPSKSGKKVRWELEKTFELKRRIATWTRRSEKMGASLSYAQRRKEELGKRRKEIAERIKGGSNDERKG